MIQTHMTRTMGDGKVEVTIECDNCHEPNSVVITIDQYRKYVLQNDLIQNYMSDIEPPKRELFISGTCPDCFKQMWAMFEDEDAWTPNEDGMN